MLTVVKSKPVCFPLSIYTARTPPFICRLPLTVCCWPAGSDSVTGFAPGSVRSVQEAIYIYRCVCVCVCLCTCGQVCVRLCVCVCVCIDWQRVCAFVLSCLDMDTARVRSETGANCSRQRHLLWLHHSTGPGSAPGHQRPRAARVCAAAAAAPVSVVFYSNTVRCTFEHALRK